MLKTILLINNQEQKLQATLYVLTKNNATNTSDILEKCISKHVPQSLINRSQFHSRH